MNNARETALHILYDIEYNGAYSNIALKNALAADKNMKNTDKAFITRLVYGVVSCKLNLEYIITQNSKIKLKKISKYIMLILKIGIYQIKYMDKVPQSAAVNESVKLAKKYGHGASAGFVNAVLHAVIKNEIVYPNDKIKSLSYELSYPEELCRKWCGDFGYEFTKDLLISMNKDAEMTLRVNTLKTDATKLAELNKDFTVSELYENALVCGGFDIASSDIYKKGYVYPQDISAMMASVVMSPEEGERVLDLCAAPGGKTTHMAELMKNRGEVIACDIHEHKIKLIENNAKRMGIDIIKVMQLDACEYNKAFDSAFDRVLADVPCSGLGIIRKKPDIKWKNDSIDKIISISQKILTNAGKYVKIGGELVFSTCTINRAENEDRFFEFLENNKNFEAADICEYLPEKLRHDTAKKGYITFYPNKDGIDGFFIAKTKRCR